MGPARMLWKVVRGMVPHKTARGTAALKNLRLKPGRKFTRLGDLAASIGWHHNELLGRLEDKRRVGAEAYYTTKKELTKLKAQALENASAKLAPVNASLAEFGF